MSCSFFTILGFIYWPLNDYLFMPFTYAYKIFMYTYVYAQQLHMVNDCSLHHTVHECMYWLILRQQSDCWGR